MAQTFRGGVYISENKNARKLAAEKIHVPWVSIAAEHLHASAGDIVDKGQAIGSNGGCPAHASVSGRVTETARGFIKIENDGEDRPHADVRPFYKKINETSAHEIIEIIRQAGVAEHAALLAAMGRVSTLIISGAESEPYLTAAHRLMLEAPELIINGAKILLKALGLKKCVIAVEDNKINAANALSAAAKKSKLIELKMLRAKYPQCDERQLIFAVTGKEIAAESEPPERGCAVIGAEAAAAICRAFTEGMPLVERIVTVDGDCIASPKNLIAPLGAPVSALIAYCGLKKEPGIIITGGPMTGAPAPGADAPVTRGTAAVLVFSSGHIKKMSRKSMECIRCGRCAESCPMRLQPLYLAMFAQQEDLQACGEYNIASCAECGCCQYICPAGVPIVRHIKDAKEKDARERQLNERE